MSKNPGHSVHGGGFHFQIANTLIFVLKGAQFLSQISVPYRSPQYSSLWCIKPDIGNGTGTDGFIRGKFLQQFFIRFHHVWNGIVRIPFHMIDKSLCKFPDENIIGGIIMHYVIQSNGQVTDYKIIHTNIGGQTTGSTNSNNIQGGQLLLDLALFKINIYQGIEFVEYDIDVVRANARRNYADAFAPIGSCMYFEFTVV